MEKLVLSRMEGLNKISLVYQILFYNIKDEKEVSKTNRKLVKLLAESYDPEFESVQSKYVVMFGQEFINRKIEIFTIISKSIDDNWDIDRINLVDRALISYATLSLLKLNSNNFEARSRVIVNDTMDLAKVFTIEKNLPFIQKTLHNIVLKLTD